MKLKSWMGLAFLPDSRSFRFLWIGAIVHAWNIFCVYTTGPLQRFAPLGPLYWALGSAMDRLGPGLPDLRLADVILTTAWPLWLVLMGLHPTRQDKRVWIPLVIGLVLVGSRLRMILFTWVFSTHSFH